VIFHNRIKAEPLAFAKKQLVDLMKNLLLRKNLLLAGLALMVLVTTVACGQIQTTQTGVPQSEEELNRARLENIDDSIFSSVFSPSDGENQGGGIGVNSFLWRATLDTISFMPLITADAFGGVILTDWRASLDVPNERFKMNIYILGRQLRADGIQVSVFRQVLDNNVWRDANVPAETMTKVEDAILTRARQLRSISLSQ
jgi:hypothetical protein